MLSGVLVVVAIVGVTIAIGRDGGKDDDVAAILNRPVDADVDDSRLPAAQPATSSATTTPQPATTTTATTTVAAPAASGPATYTLAQVSAHATASDCWTAVRGTVYNVTPFVGRHPGGVDAIAQICGRDATAVFDGQHGGQKVPESVLASLKVGVLAQ